MTSFGLALPSFASPGAALFRTPALAEVDAQLCLDLAREAETLGFDSLWAPDHLMIGRDDAVLEGWTLLSAIAAVTRVARLGLIQQSNLFRSPGVSAKAATTLDLLSGGRLIYFCGPGVKLENDAFGLDAGLDADGRADRLIEAVGVMRTLWSGQRVDHSGHHYRLTGARAAPVSSEPPPIWFASLDPAILEALAPVASGWCTPPVSPREATRRVALVGDALEKAGRRRDAIEFGLETQVLIGDDLADVRTSLAAMLTLDPPGVRPPLDPDGIAAFVRGETDHVPTSLTERWLVGTPDSVARRIGEYRAGGITHFVLWFMDIPSRVGMHRFRDHVMPLIG